MSDKSTRTEQPTQKKLGKAREEGQLPRSKELPGSLIMFSLVAGVAVGGRYGADMFQRIFREMFVGAFRMRGDTFPSEVIETSFIQAYFYLLFPFLLFLMVVAVCSTLALGGFNFAMKAAKFNFSKLNPVNGMKKFVSLDAMVNLLRSAAIVSVLLWITWGAIKSELPEIPMLVTAPVAIIGTKMKDILLRVGFRFALFLLLLAIGDYFYQKLKFTREMKMTKQEVKDEMKEADGNPQVKAKIRQKQFQFAYRNMLKQVPKATAVVTNPTHFAVAIRYQPEEMEAPEVVAKGVDHLALRIRRIAEDNDVPIVEDRPLAQALYHSAEVGKRIPTALFKAVAELLAYLYKTGKWKQKL